MKPETTGGASPRHRSTLFEGLWLLPRRPASPNEAGQIGALLDLYFAVTSRSGTWSFQEMAGSAKRVWSR
jgi:hypothetical protein